MLGEKRGESLFFQTEKAAEPKPVVMELQMVERGVQAVESHQPNICHRDIKSSPKRE